MQWISYTVSYWNDRKKMVTQDEDKIQRLSLLPRNKPYFIASEAGKLSPAGLPFHTCHLTWGAGYIHGLQVACLDNGGREAASCRQVAQGQHHFSKVHVLLLQTNTKQ